MVESLVNPADYPERMIAPLLRLYRQYESQLGLDFNAHYQQQGFPMARLLTELYHSGQWHALRNLGELTAIFDRRLRDTDNYSSCQTRYYEELLRILTSDPDEFPFLLVRFHIDALEFVPEATLLADWRLAEEI